jgi:hypothetical protein
VTSSFAFETLLERYKVPRMLMLTAVLMLTVLAIYHDHGRSPIISLCCVAILYEAFELKYYMLTCLS